jgi:GTP cyclohydrolase I
MTDRRIFDSKLASTAVRTLLEALGEDPARAGLQLTPDRVAGAYAELLEGTHIDPASVLETLPGERGEGLIMVRDVPLYGICEHHLLPFVGHGAIGYLPGPDGRICGLSKLARLIEVLSRRLTVQERLVAEAADAMEKALAPRGVFVLVEAEHLCMTMRGAQAPGSVTVTTEVRGAFRDDPALRAEALALAHGRR